MATPSPKPNALENLLEGVYGRNRAESIRGNVCVSCQGEATQFRNFLSEKEYTISGLCQACQDSVFVTGEDDCYD